MPLWTHLEAGGKRSVAVWHRRAGKDEICLQWACIAAHQRPASYWHMLPEAAHARKAIWDSINPHTGIRRIDEVFPKELRETTREQEMLIKFKSGSTWQVVGSDNYNRLVGSPPAGVVFSEWSIANPAAWAYLRPILAENNGWATFIYTARGRNHGYKTYLTAKESGWFAELLTVEDTNVIPKEILDNELTEYIREYGQDEGEALFRQEYYCDWNAPLLGSYYGKDIRRAEAEGRITQVVYDPAVPVHTAWDIGYRDDTAIWWYQVVRDEIHIIDYYAASGMEISHYADVLRAKPYKYAVHHLPHDAKAKTLASGGKSTEEQLRYHLGGGNVWIVPELSVQDGIQAARAMFPHAWIDETNCEQGVEALRQYQREWDDDKKAFREKPRHDWTSHCADAFRMLAVAWRQENIEVRKPPEDITRPLTLNERLSIHDRKYQKRSRI